MLRIAGINIPEDKRLEIGLTAVYGIGRTKALRILESSKVDPAKKPGDLTSGEETNLRSLVESESIEGELRREVGAHIKRLRDIKSYRGSRHTRRLPARGQRTRTNARTLKGVKKTMGSGKRKTEKT